MKKSISNVVAGGLITSATVMGVDAIHSTAEAALMDTKQTREFNYNVAANTVDCCFDAFTVDSNLFVFDGFDAALGVLNTATLGISFSNLNFEPTDVTGFSGQIAGLNLNTVDAVDFARNLNTVDLDIAQFAKDLNTATIDFNMLFIDDIFPTGETKGTMTLSYIYEAAVVPLPGSLALMAPALAALLASGAYRRRKREADE